MAYFVVQNEEGADGEGVQGIQVFNSFTTGIAGQDPSGPPNNARVFDWLPYDTLLKNIIFRFTAAPGATKIANMRFKDDSDTNLSSIIQISNSAVDVLTDLEATMPALDPTSDTTIRNTIHYLSNWPSATGNAPGTAYRSYEYLSSLHPELCYFVCNIGADVQTATFSATNAYASIVGGSIASGNTTQQPRQVPMVASGKIKVAWACWRGFDNTNTVQAAIQKGTLGAGADTTIVFNMTGPGTTAPYTASILTPSVSLAAGDYVNWRIQRTAGAATGGAIQLGFGYAIGL